jgi:hypothetical protein
MLGGCSSPGSSTGLRRPRGAADRSQLCARQRVLPFQAHRPHPLPDDRRSAPRGEGAASDRPQSVAGKSGRRLSATRCAIWRLPDLRFPPVRLPHPFLRGGRWPVFAPRSNRFDSAAGNDRRVVRREGPAAFAERGRRRAERSVAKPCVKSGERTRLACWFRRPRRNNLFRKSSRWRRAPSPAREARALPRRSENHAAFLWCFAFLAALFLFPPLPCAFRLS